MPARTDSLRMALAVCGGSSPSRHKACRGIPSCRLEAQRGSMHTKALVDITPVALVDLIKAKHQQLLNELPGLLDVREQELSRAFAAAKAARSTMAEDPSEANTQAYNECEAFRRSAESRVYRLRDACANTEQCMAYWADETEPWRKLLDARDQVDAGHAPRFKSKKKNGGETS